MTDKPKYEIQQDCANRQVAIRIVGTDRRAWGKYKTKTEAREAIRGFRADDREGLND